MHVNYHWLHVQLGRTQWTLSFICSAVPSANYFQFWLSISVITIVAWEKKRQRSISGSKKTHHYHTNESLQLSCLPRSYKHGHNLQEHSHFQGTIKVIIPNPKSEIALGSSANIWERERFWKPRWILWIMMDAHSKKCFQTNLLKCTMWILLMILQFWQIFGNIVLTRCFKSKCFKHIS